jgi:hypothetical protein
VRQSVTRPARGKCIELALEPIAAPFALVDGIDEFLEDNLLRRTGSTCSESQRRCAAFQVARPVYRMSLRADRFFQTRCDW